MIERVFDDKTAKECENLLTKLIIDEKKYDNSIDENTIISNYFINVIKDKKNILLCYRDNSIVKGFIFLKPIKNNDLDGYLIDGLYVLSEYRRQGIAKKLIKEAISLTKVNKYSFITMNVLYNNEVARKLYKSIGFNEFMLNMKLDV